MVPIIFWPPDLFTLQVPCFLESLVYFKIHISVETIVGRHGLFYSPSGKPLMYRNVE
ncbi:hypothetical protein Cabys_2761 [Caldithrix abyssi DSM 13497]|uniref:Uncharacterized protein n=1 Tax=Caldithrix abyssi DSM 13497 TaxID=880073 RepID=A0A1J1C9Z5_CALAY|nr:hypothetical protein Cabys_2761 [Caldithrix abyssi DSM 13497]